MLWRCAFPRLDLVISFETLRRPVGLRRTGGARSHPRAGSSPQKGYFA